MTKKSALSLIKWMGLPEKLAYNKVIKKDVPFLNGYYAHVICSNFIQLRVNCVAYIDSSEYKKLNEFNGF